MNKLRAELNRSLTNWIALREHAAANSVTGLENSDGNSSAREFNRGC
jgi:hypothetical protein